MHMYVCVYLCLSASAMQTTQYEHIWVQYSSALRSTKSCSTPQLISVHTERSLRLHQQHNLATSLLNTIGMAVANSKTKISVCIIMQLQYVYVYTHCITQELRLRAQRRLRNSLLYCQIKTKSKVLPEVSRMGPKRTSQ